MKKLKKDLQRITKIKTLINIYDWEGINFPSEKDDWTNFEKNVTIALNVQYAKNKKEYILLMLQNITKIVKNKLFF